MSADPTNHCPVCMTGYPYGVTKCVDDGATLEAGPAPAPEVSDGFDDDEAARGSVTMVPVPAESRLGVDDLFSQEEMVPRRMVLAEVVPEDAQELVDTLVGEGIGARIGAATNNGGVLVLIHEQNLPDAQGILVDFTGDPGRVDDIRYADDGEDLTASDAGSAYVEVSSPMAADAPAQLERLLGAGIDVHMQPSGDGGHDPRVPVGLMVGTDDLDRARDVLGITL
ncbi:MAG: hypothetical protein ABI828_02850 [Actinomycetota bacterium]